jgi:hypothetical protein
LQLKETCDVLPVHRLAMKLDQQIENDIRLPELDRVADRLQIILDAQHTHFVTEFAERGDDVVLGLVEIDLFRRQAFHRRRRHAVGMT